MVETTMRRAGPPLSCFEENEQFPSSLFFSAGVKVAVTLVARYPLAVASFSQGQGSAA
jgi:hypothetical protein